MAEEEGVLETVRKTVEGSKKDLEEARRAIDILEAIDIDTKELRKSFEDAKKDVDKMEKAYGIVKARE